MNGHAAMSKRALFGKFFTIENLNFMTPQILKVVEKDMQDILAKNWNGTNEWKKLDVGQILLDIFAQVVTSILFNDDMVYVDGVTLPMAINNYINGGAANVFNLWNILSFDMFNYLGIGKRFKENRDLYKRISDVCYEKYMKRYNEGLKGGTNMLDLMIS